MAEESKQAFDPDATVSQPGAGNAQPDPEATISQPIVLDPEATVGGPLAKPGPDPEATDRRPAFDPEATVNPAERVNLDPEATVRVRRPRRL